MTTRDTRQKIIQVYAHWQGMSAPDLMGNLYATPSRGKEIFSFEYDEGWLKNTRGWVLDPHLGLYKGPQYAPQDRANFGVFLDSTPDRWGRFLLQRREAMNSRAEKRPEKNLLESDYLLGVFDGHRPGGLRFKLEQDGPFLDDCKTQATPPWTSLRELEQASFNIEKKGSQNSPDHACWLNMLLAPGGSLGGARPKAGVMDEQGNLWIAKFPSCHDEIDMGAWEALLSQLAHRAGVDTPETTCRIFSGRHHTFLSKRFDRTRKGERIHFASAMTLLQRRDGDDATTGASYLELADFIIRHGAQTDEDLEQLWRRIVFFICVSNTDDHLRNHGFIHTPAGWALSPAYDMNPVMAAHGLKLNISETDNSLDIALAESVSKYFRLTPQRANRIIKKITSEVKKWREIARGLKISASEQDLLSSAFQITSPTP